MDVARERPVRRRRWPLLVAIVAIGVLVLVSTRDSANTTSVPRDRLWVGEVEEGPLVHEARGAGRLVPRDLRWISAETGGTVETVASFPGSRVEAGTEILTLSNPALHEALRAAELDLRVAEADLAALSLALEDALLDARSALARLEVESEQAELAESSLRELQAEGLESKTSVERAGITVQGLRTLADLERQRVDFRERTFEHQLGAARARIDRSRARRDLVQHQVRGLTVVATRAGTVQQLPVEPGARVAAGDRLAQIADPEALGAELQIPEYQAQDLHPGLTGEVRIGSGVVSTRVTRVHPRVEEGAVLVDLELLGSLPAGARPDLAIQGVLEIRRIPRTLFVSRPATAEPNQPGVVFRLDADQKRAERVSVQYGRASRDRIEVLQGLALGDQVVLSDTSRWAESRTLLIDG